VIVIDVMMMAMVMITVFVSFNLLNLNEPGLD